MFLSVPRARKRATQEKKTNVKNEGEERRAKRTETQAQGGTSGDLEQAGGLLGFVDDRKGDGLELQLVRFDPLKVQNVAHQRKQVLRAV